jgi:hypothetical protein
LRLEQFQAQGFTLNTFSLESLSIIKDSLIGGKMSSNLRKISQNFIALQLFSILQFFHFSLQDFLLEAGIKESSFDEFLLRGKVSEETKEKILVCLDMSEEEFMAFPLRMLKIKIRKPEEFIFTDARSKKRLKML